MTDISKSSNSSKKRFFRRGVNIVPSFLRLSNIFKYPERKPEKIGFNDGHYNENITNSLSNICSSFKQILNQDQLINGEQVGTLFNDITNLDNLLQNWDSFRYIRTTDSIMSLFDELNDFRTSKANLNRDLDDGLAYTHQVSKEEIQQFISNIFNHLKDDVTLRFREYNNRCSNTYNIVNVIHSIFSRFTFSDSSQPIYSSNFKQLEDYVHSIFGRLQNDKLRNQFPRPHERIYFK